MLLKCSTSTSTCGWHIIVDELTLADQADIKFVLNSWDDVCVAEPKSFAAIKDITIA